MEQLDEIKTFDQGFQEGIHRLLDLLFWLVLPITAVLAPALVHNAAAGCFSETRLFSRLCCSWASGQMGRWSVCFLHLLMVWKFSAEEFVEA